MKTRQAAINKMKSYGLKSFYVYQYPRGHWDGCSLDSENGIALKETGKLSYLISVDYFELIAGEN